MTKIIFLDIDGVLNSNLWNESHQKEISEGTLIDEDKVKLLSLLVKKTEAQIILHSGWRFWFNKNLKALCIEAKILMELFEKEGIILHGSTPDLTTEEIRRTKKFSLVKADEIFSYLEMNADITNWIVIDDLDLNNSIIRQHQIKTDASVGLTLEDVEKAEEMLLHSF